LKQRTRRDPNALPILARREFTSRSGHRINFTTLGFGTAPLGNLYRPIDNAQALQTLQEAWALGVRYYDTAPLYGLGIGETRLGSFLRDGRATSLSCRPRSAGFCSAVRPTRARASASSSTYRRAAWSTTIRTTA